MKVLALAGLLVATELPPPTASCLTLCSCNWERDPLKARDAFPVVLEGRALDSTLAAPRTTDANGRERFRVRVVVGQVWKGDVPDTIVVVTSEPASGCGFSFARGERYLLFLFRNSSGSLSATMCSLSQPWERADSIVTALGTPVRKGAT